MIRRIFWYGWVSDKRSLLFCKGALLDFHEIRAGLYQICIAVGDPGSEFPAALLALAKPAIAAPWTALPAPGQRDSASDNLSLLMAPCFD